MAEFVRPARRYYYFSPAADRAFALEWAVVEGLAAAAFWALQLPWEGRKGIGIRLLTCRRSFAGVLAAASRKAVVVVAAADMSNHIDLVYRKDLLRECQRIVHVRLDERIED